jgi:hypothetical protein
VDHASCKIFHHPQVSLDAAETIRGKQLVEAAASNIGRSVKAYHSDNGIFSSEEFRGHCNHLGQSLSFSGVGAHHQNGVAERSIGTVSRLARANLIHLQLCWPDRANLNLWALAMNYAVWVYNRLPNDALGGLSPDEFWTGTRSNHIDLRRAHVFGCPVYVLDAALQDNKKIPKWKSRARMGMFVGFSTEHSSLVPLVLNLRTGSISPQYHVIFDDKFETVPSLNISVTNIDNTFAELYNTNSDFYLDPVEEDDHVIIPSLEAEWDVDASEGDIPAVGSEGAIPTGVSEGASTIADSEGVHVSEGDTSRYPSRSTRNQNPVYTAAVALATLPLGMALHTWAQPPSSFLNDPRETDYHPNAKLTYGSLDENSLLRTSWESEAAVFSVGYGGSTLNQPWDVDHDFGIDAPDPQLARVQSLMEPSLFDPPGDPIISSVQPHVFAAKARANSADNPSYEQAMNGEHRREYYLAAKKELSTLQDDLNCWSVVPWHKRMNVLHSTWAFKCKRYPDGRVKQFKARFCARGDQQQEGIDYFETWSPVVQWTTVRVMMILSVILGLKTHQADITAAFVHATLPPEEEVFIRQPQGFIKPGTTKYSHVLRLNRALYGLKQAPRHFFKYLATHLIKHGLKQSEYDPCLFIGPDVIAVVYVDDILLYSLKEDPIDRLITQLKDDGIWIRKEDSAAGFLGVDMKHQKGCITLSQTGLIERIITAMGLHSEYSTSKDTPAETSPLPRDINGEPDDSLINYPSVIGMLLYLSGHTRPDISFAVHQCARYTFKPTVRHVKALKRIGRYLKGTRTKGLIMSPSSTLSVDCYPDADFAGLYNTEDAQDPHCVRSRTGFIILLAGVPVLWFSKLQGEIALSTMEAEYIALSQSCKSLFPLLDQIRELGSAVGLPVEEYTNMHVKIHEDNVGALTLGKLEPRRMTPRSKHYAIKYHWFREQIEPRKIKLVKIATKDQLGDMFTKGLGSVPFSYLRSKIMGW